MNRIKEPNCLKVTYWNQAIEEGVEAVQSKAESWLDFVALLRASKINYPRLKTIHDLASGYLRAAENDIKTLGKEQDCEGQ